MEETEIWKPIPGYEGYYEVSSHGRVRSVDRVLDCADGRKRRFRGKILALNKSMGYPCVGLCMPGEQATHKVHVLVARAFHGEPDEGQEVRHLDGSRTNNHVENLRWGTRSENWHDALDHGAAIVGEAHYGAKLTEEDVENIRYLWDVDGWLQRDIAEEFGVDQGHVSAIVNRKVWKHLD